MPRTLRLPNALGLAVALSVATPKGALADHWSLRPLGGEHESALTVGRGGWGIEAGAWTPRLGADLPPANALESEVFQRWNALPSWPEIRVLHGLQDGNEVIVRTGSVVNAGYRKMFLSAEAPWGDEFLQALIQGGVGLHLASLRPMVYANLPGVYHNGPFTLHIAGGGYYLFNDQPIVEGTLGVELRPLSFIDFGAAARLRMDSKKMTPNDGSWSYSGGLRLRPFPRWQLQVEAGQDVGPPTPAGGTPAFPRIEWPLQSVRATLSTHF
ncbi:MAG: hypothetical protein VKN33_01700 [Candidatus Sericytochromatia bacterium]|nr:hypothetical protein [Candidatus Sericytochromatia bacterium]